MRTVHGLQINQNLAFQRREWRVQRIGWWLLAAFVAAAALGLFGDGVLSRAHARTPDGGVDVEYERFIRARAPTRLTIRAAGASSRELRLDRAYFEALDVDRIVPEPARIAIAGEAVQLIFDPTAPGDFVVLLDVEPRQAGRHRATVQAGAAPPVTFTQFAWF